MGCAHLLPLGLVALSLACNDVADELRDVMATKVHHASPSARRAAVAAAEQMSELERHRQELDLFDQCAGDLRRDVEASWRVFQALSGNDGSTEPRNPGNKVSDCARVRTMIDQTDPDFPDLEEALEQSLDKARAYQAALERYLALSSRTEVVPSLAPEREALASAVESAYIGWSVALADLDKHIEARRKEGDLLELEGITERSGRRGEYHAQKILLAADRAQACTERRQTVHGCLAQLEGVAAAVEEFESFLAAHPSAVDTVFWLPVFKQAALRLGPASQAVIEGMKEGGDPGPAVKRWMEAVDVMARHGRRLRFNAPHPVRTVPAATPPP